MIAGKNLTPSYNVPNVASSRTASAPFALHHAPHRAGDMAEDHATKSTPFLKQSLNTIQFSRSSVGGSRYLVNAHTNASSTDGTTELMFESRFESGNLAKAIKVTPVYYELYLRPDLYTNKHTQWFYFRVTNTRKNLTYRFVVGVRCCGTDDTTQTQLKCSVFFSFFFFSSNRLSIVNLVKSGSLYNEGMRPLMYSVTDAKDSNIGWRRCGDNISYFKNDDNS